MSQISLTEPSNQILSDYMRDKKIKPHPVQEEFLSLPDEIFEALFGGAAYGGKTWLLTLLPLFRGFYKYRGFKGIIFRRKFPDLEREIIRLSKEYYPKTGGVYNESRHSWHWPEFDSYVDFGHVQHSSDISMYDSSQYNLCEFDELTHFDGYPYLYMVGSRVRPGNSSCNVAIVRNGTNPGGIGQTFVYDRFVKPDEDGRKIIKDNGTGLLRIFIPAHIEDNPSGLEYDPAYAEKLKLLPEAEYRAKRYGDWHAFKGSVFTTFRPIHFPNEPDNAIHVIEPFTIPEWWPRILSIDWGKRALCHALWGAIAPNKRVYAYRERTWKNVDIYRWASEIREINDASGEGIESATICGSAWQDRGTETIADQFQRYSGMAPNSSENSAGSRIIGLQLIHDFMRWDNKNLLKSREAFYDMKKAQEIYRLYGPVALENYKRQFYDEESEANLPVLQIFNTCKVLIETIPNCIYDEKKIEDIAEFDGDDPIDNLRYFCKTAKKFLLGEAGNLSAEVKRQNVLAELEVHQDMTRYYRQMEYLERTQESGMLTTTIPLSRHSRFARRARYN